MEDFADIPFKLSDRIGQNLKDLDGEEDSEHEYDHKKKNLTPRKKPTNYAIIQKPKKTVDEGEMSLMWHWQFDILLAESAKGSC